MKSIRHVAVVDIGKTNVKLALVDLASVAEIGTATMPNRIERSGDYYPHHDTDSIR